MARVTEKKTEKLVELNELVDAAVEKYRHAPGEQQVVAILGLFLGALNCGNVSPAMIHEAWEELYELGKVVREDFALCPVPARGTWVVLPMVGIVGNEEA